MTPAARRRYCYWEARCSQMTKLSFPGGAIFTWLSSSSHILQETRESGAVRRFPVSLILRYNAAYDLLGVVSCATFSKYA